MHHQNVRVAHGVFVETGCLLPVRKGGGVVYVAMWQKYDGFYYQMIGGYFGRRLRESLPIWIKC